MNKSKMCHDTNNLYKSLNVLFCDFCDTLSLLITVKTYTDYIKTDN